MKKVLFKMITFNFPDRQSLDVSTERMPALQQSGMLRTMMKEAQEEGTPIPLAISKQSFEMIVRYLDFMALKKNEGMPQDQIQNAIIEMLKVVERDRDLVAILTAADYLDVPLVLDAARDELARRLQQDDRLQQYSIKTGIQLDLHPVMAQVVAQVVMSNYGAHLLQRIEVPSQILAGHTSRINSVVFSPDGTLLATGSLDGTARIWNVLTGELVYTIAGTGSVNSIAFSPDGTLLAIGSGDRTAQIWNVSTGELVHELVGHTDLVNSVAFSPDGTLLATGSGDNTPIIWSVSNGKLVHMLLGHTGWIYSVAFSPDGTLLATGSVDETARIWNVSTGKLVHTLLGHTDLITSVAFSPDGKLLATRSFDETARIWKVSTGETVHKLVGHTSRIDSVAFSPDGKRLATGSSDFTARIWNAATGEQVHMLAEHDGYVYSVAFSPDGTLLTTGSSDKTARIWNVSTGDLMHTLAGHDGYVYSVAFSPDGKLLATGSRDRTARIWNLGPLLQLLNMIKSLTLEQALLIVALYKYSNKGMPLNLKQYPHLQEIFNTLDPEIQKSLQPKSESAKPWWKWW